MARKKAAPSKEPSQTVNISAAKKAQTATTVLLHLGAGGNVYTTTVRAFTAAEMDKIVAKVHGE